MPLLDKHALLDQLAERLRQSDRLAHRAELEAREAARTLATESEKKEDGRAVIEYGSLATGQAQRARRVQEELQALSDFQDAGLPRAHRPRRRWFPLRHHPRLPRGPRPAGPSGGRYHRSDAGRRGPRVDGPRGRLIPGLIASVLPDPPEEATDGDMSV